MKRSIVTFNLLIVILLQSVGLISRGQEELPPIPETALDIKMLFPGSITANHFVDKVNEHTYLVLVEAGETAQIIMTRQQGVFIPRLRLRDAQGTVLEEVTASDLAGRVSELNYTSDSATWLFVDAVAADWDENEAGYNLNLNNTTPRIYDLLGLAPPPDDALIVLPEAPLTLTNEGRFVMLLTAGDDLIITLSGASEGILTDLDGEILTEAQAEDDALILEYEPDETDWAELQVQSEGEFTAAFDHQQSIHVAAFVILTATHTPSNRPRITATFTPSLTPTITPSPVPSRESLNYGETVLGRLSDGSAEEWEFQGTAGDRVTIDMQSSDFDALVELYDNQQVLLVQDDDSGESINALIEGFELPSNGTYIIRAASYNAESRGRYTLVLNRSVPATSTPIRIPTNPPSQSASCGGRTTPFEIGDIVVVDFNRNGALRILDRYDGGAQQTLVQAYDNDQLELIDGPVCHENRWLWRVYFGKRNVYGWAAEGDNTGRWLCSLSNPECR